jgi:mycofactocin biosynthesis protein MftB
VSEALLERALGLHERVALRPEPFGALAYHYGTRRLIFLKHPDVVRVVGSLGEHPDVRTALESCGIAEHRWPAFCTALTSLVESEMLHERTVTV